MVVEIENVRIGGISERTQECGRWELLLLVDVHVADVVDVERELDPRPAEGDDPRAVELRAVGVDVLLEDDTG